MPTVVAFNVLVRRATAFTALVATLALLPDAVHAPVVGQARPVPSDTTARIVESQQEEQNNQTPDTGKEKKAMSIEELLKLLSEKPELREALLGKLGLAEKAARAESWGVTRAGGTIAVVALAASERDELR